MLPKFDPAVAVVVVDVESEAVEHQVGRQEDRVVALLLQILLYHLEVRRLAAVRRELLLGRWEVQVALPRGILQIVVHQPRGR